VLNIKKKIYAVANLIVIILLYPISRKKIKCGISSGCKVVNIISYLNLRKMVLYLNLYILIATQTHDVCWDVETMVLCCLLYESAAFVLWLWKWIMHDFELLVK